MDWRGDRKNVGEGLGGEKGGEIVVRMTKKEKKEGNKEEREKFKKIG